MLRSHDVDMGPCGTSEGGDSVRLGPVGSGAGGEADVEDGSLESSHSVAA